MCGIAGLYDRRMAGRADQAVVQTMGKALAHRGPDGQGTFCWPDESPSLSLDIRRLSIIDLETGDQPIHNEDRTVTVVCNGEIYNDRQLRRALKATGHRFRTKSDVEVLVHLYEEEGLGLFERLRGMYAFALWDQPRRRLLLATDHLAIKPLYVAEQDGLVWFASEAKALLADPRLPRQVDENSIDTFLTFGYLLGGTTLYKGIRRLEPGQALVISPDSISEITHWQLGKPGPDGEPAEELGEDSLRARLDRAVEIHLRSDVPVGLFLSGGLDSASLLACVKAVSACPLPTFSLGYAGPHGRAHDESDHAARVAAHFGVAHRRIELAARDWWSRLPAYVFAHDEPNANPSAVSMLALAEAAAAEVKAVLVGLGGDELCAGYPFHAQLPAALRWSARLDRTLPHGLRKLLGRTGPILQAAYPRVRRRRGLSGALGWLIARQRIAFPAPELLQRTLSFDGLASSGQQRLSLYGPQLPVSRGVGQTTRAFEQLLAPETGASPEDLVQRLVMKTWLPANGLLSLDKVTMAHGLEARVPFFDRDLLAASLRTPSYRRRPGTKHALRQAMRQELPASVLHRPKRAFSTPHGAWIDHELADPVQQVLLDRRSLNRGWFEPAAVRALVTDHYRGAADHTEMVFRLLIFELWQQATMDGPPHVPVVPEAGR
jgi:asparagine synthase (glutamine-hydrolysing)